MTLSNELLVEHFAVGSEGEEEEAFTWWTMAWEQTVCQHNNRCGVQPTSPTTTRPSKVLQLHLLTDSEGVVR